MTDPRRRTTLHVSAPPALRRKVERAARKARRGLSDWVRLAIDTQADRELEEPGEAA